MPLKSSFAIVLRALRSKRNITQRGFADTTSRTDLSKLESGKSSITLDKLEQLSDRLELSPLALLTLTLSEDTGVPTAALISKLSEEIRVLASDGGLPELSVLTPPPEFIDHTAVARRRPGRSAGHPVSAIGSGQAELPL
ncbi:transcriptional regulator with XRE-family HTH domain [Pseudomonas sp. TE6349]